VVKLEGAIGRVPAGVVQCAYGRYALNKERNSQTKERRALSGSGRDKEKEEAQ